MPYLGRMLIKQISFVLETDNIHFVKNVVNTECLNFLWLHISFTYNICIKSTGRVKCCICLDIAYSSLYMTYKSET